MEKVRPWCGQPSDRGRLKNRTTAAAAAADRHSLIPSITLPDDLMRKKATISAINFIHIKSVIVTYVYIKHCSTDSHEL